MKYNWKVNINELENALRRPNLSVSDEINIKNLISIKKGSKEKTYNTDFFRINNISEGKILYLSKMIQEYNYLGEKFIRFIISLKDIYKFDIPKLNFSFRNNIDLRIEQSLDLLSNLNNEIYKVSKEIINSKSIIPVKNVNFSSYMTYVYSLNKPFMVIDTGDNPHSLIHELAHAFEAKIDLIEPELYTELGPITLETLFIDKLVDDKVVGSKKLHFSRLIEDILCVDELYDYFNAMLIIKEKNFNISDSEFKTILTEVMQVNEDYILKYLEDEISGNIAIEELTYLISHIKSLEIRELILCDKKLGLIELKKCLTSQSTKFNSKSIESVKRYVKEISL